MSRETLGPRQKGRTFNNDLLRGEGNIPTDGLGPGVRTRGKFSQDTPQTEDLRNGLTHRTTTDPYRAKKKANAQPSGGGGGKWKEMNEKLAASRAELQGEEVEEGTAASGTSIFDPVLCEIAYRWFCPRGGMVLDPFAGGSVRGIVASRLGLNYTGMELRPEQVQANVAQLGLAGDPPPVWLQGDSRNLAELCASLQADLVFSCPPYWNLEVYSDDPADLSTFGKEEFFAAQAQIIKAAVSLLKPNRFAVWVTSDIRDKEGYYANLPGRTIQAFEDAGARLYNDAVLITAAGSLPVRTRKQFQSGRKLGRTHQYVQVYCKGDWKKAVAALGEPEFGEIDQSAQIAALPAVDDIGGAV